ncbi:hypothetical protein DA102_035705 [Sinorhizobium meliloti]|nr:hypothetical protein DA102_035705 [Sinorhizobium meliloti]
MKRSPDNTSAAGLPTSPKFRSRWLLRILAATALALATTAQAPTASASDEDEKEKEKEVCAMDDIECFCRADPYDDFDKCRCETPEAAWCPDNGRPQERGPRGGVGRG